MKKSRKRHRISIQDINKEKTVNQIITSEPWHVPEGGLIRQFIFGAEDGMVGTLGVVAGIVGASVSGGIVVLAGIAEIVAGAFSMAAGTYLSTKSQVEFYDKEIEREKKEIEELPNVEREEIRVVYRAKGFKGNELESIVKRITSDKKIWLDVMMEEELGLVRSKFEKPGKAAIVMAGSFILGGILPLAPYFIFDVSRGLIASVSLTAIGLFGVGASKTILTRGKWWKSGSEMLVVGLLAAGVAFLIGRVIGRIIGGVV